MGYAYFVKQPRILKDLFAIHAIDQEHQYEVVKEIELPLIDYENFITDMTVDRQYLEDNADLCSMGTCGSASSSSVRTRRTVSWSFPWIRHGSAGQRIRECEPSPLQQDIAMIPHTTDSTQMKAIGRERIDHDDIQYLSKHLSAEEKNILVPAFDIKLPNSNYDRR